MLVARALQQSARLDNGPVQLLEVFKSSMHCKIVYARLEAETAKQALGRLLRVLVHDDMQELKAAFPERPADLEVAFAEPVPLLP